MANRVDIDRAIRGKEVWNEWAVKNAGIKTDFSEDRVDNIDFSGFIFPGIANFRNATLSSGILFREARFSALALFEGAAFTGEASFEEALFSASVNYRNVRFASNTFFAGATFSDGAIFEGAEFRTDVSFDDAIFGAEDPRLDASVSFSNARFVAEAKFMRTRFRNITRFEKATFYGNAIFEKATFSADSWFSDATFSADARFNGAAFNGEVTVFRNAKFMRSNFSKAKFSRTPDFRGVDDSVSFQGVQFDFIDDNNETNYAEWLRKLKSLAIAGSDHEMELQFFAREMRAKRRDELTGSAKWTERVWNASYELTSNYGISVTRPALGLALVFGLFAFSYKTLLPKCDYIHHLTLSFKSLLPFGGGLKLEQARCCYSEQADYLVALSSIESILGVFFIFLIVLGIRNKFKIK